MNNKIGSLLAFMVVVATAVLFSVPTPSPASRSFIPDPKTIVIPDLAMDPGLFFLMAEELESTGDTTSGLEYFRKALALDPTSAYLNTRIGSILARNRRIADAMVMARAATLFDPQYEEAYTLLGKLYTVTGDNTRAVEAYARALDLKPHERDLYVFLGSLQASQRLFSEAEKTFKKMIEEFPGEREGYFYLGKVYVEDGRYDKAIDIFKQLLQTRADSAAAAHVELGAIYLLQKDLAAAESHFSEAVKLDPFNITARLNLGQVLAKQKKFAESYKVFEELGKLAPSNLGIQIKMALILAEQKKFDKAKQILDTILQTKPGWDQVRFHLGRVLKEQGKIHEAENEFNQIRKGQPMFVNSRIVLALMFLKTKEYAKAIRYIDEAADPNMKDADVLYIKGSILEELNRLTEARQIYEKALEMEPTNVRMRYSLGNALEKGGFRNRGLREMERILKEKPDDASALNFIGYTLAASGGDLDRAEKMVRKALELKPDDGYILDSLGWILHQRGQNDKALEYLQRAVVKVKNDPIVAEHLGDILLIENQREGAVTAYKNSLEANPDNLIVQEKLRKLEAEMKPSEK